MFCLSASSLFQPSPQDPDPCEGYCIDICTSYCTFVTVYVCIICKHVHLAHLGTCTSTDCTYAQVWHLAIAELQLQAFVRIRILRMHMPSTLLVHSPNCNCKLAQVGSFREGLYLLAFACAARTALASATAKKKGRSGSREYSNEAMLAYSARIQSQEHQFGQLVDDEERGVQTVFRSKVTL